MSASPHLTRRSFLYGTALAAGSAALAACSSSSSGGNGGGSDSDTAGSTSSGAGGPSEKKGSLTKSPPVPAKFQESPDLQGKGLPPVAERLPEKPFVIPHRWVEAGKYGGSLNMVVFTTSGIFNATSCPEFFYGVAPLRWQNDGLDVGPGSADSWNSNPDATEWTIHFRKGLRWSDGHPITTDDMLFWWEDVVLPGYNAQVAPLGMLSAEGNPCKMIKVDDETVKLKYDSPQPGLPFYLATGVTGHFNILPKHYLKQFHPKYNKDVPKDWDAVGGLWEHKYKWIYNPDCPTMTGYKCRSYDNNKGIVLERNPYYYAVNVNGDQLPYIDTVSMNIQQDAQVIKLQIQQGKVDYCQGSFNQIDLSDVSTLSKSKKSGDYEIVLWESGSGTGRMFFLNYDYIAKDEKYGKLFRDKRFRQAISLGFDRATAQKTRYFGTGERTTGGLGPKAPEFNAKPNGPSLYAQWRDSFKDRDVEKAKDLLDQIGLKDSDDDGYVEFPDGSKLTIDVPYKADESSTDSSHDDQLVSDMKDIGLRMARRAVSPTAFDPQWQTGQLMSHTNWEVSNGSLLVAAYWLLPLEYARWAPLEGMMYAVSGTSKEKAELDLPPLKRHPPRMAPEEGGPVAKMWDLYNRAKREPDELKRTQLFWQIVKIHIDEGPFFIGEVANYLQPMIVKNGLRNVPARENLAQGGLVNDWELPCPAVYDPEVYYWDNPQDHSD